MRGTLYSLNPCHIGLSTFFFTCFKVFLLFPVCHPIVWKKLEKKRFYQQKHFSKFGWRIVWNIRRRPQPPTFIWRNSMVFVPMTRGVVVFFSLFLFCCDTEEVEVLLICLFIIFCPIKNGVRLNFWRVGSGDSFTAKISTFDDAWTFIYEQQTTLVRFMNGRQSVVIGLSNVKIYLRSSNIRTSKLFLHSIFKIICVRLHWANF